MTFADFNSIYGSQPIRTWDNNMGRVISVSVTQNNRILAKITENGSTKHLLMDKKGLPDFKIDENLLQNMEKVSAYFLNVFPKLLPSHGKPRLRFIQTGPVGGSGEEGQVPDLSKGEEKKKMVPLRPAPTPADTTEHLKQMALVAKHLPPSEDVGGAVYAVQAAGALQAGRVHNQNMEESQRAVVQYSQGILAKTQETTDELADESMKKFKKANELGMTSLEKTLELLDKQAEEGDDELGKKAADEVDDDYIGKFNLKAETRQTKAVETYNKKLAALKKDSDAGVAAQTNELGKMTARNKAQAEEQKEVLGVVDKMIETRGKAADQQAKEIATGIKLQKEREKAAAAAALDKLKKKEEGKKIEAEGAAKRKQLETQIRKEDELAKFEVDKTKNDAQEAEYKERMKEWNAEYKRAVDECPGGYEITYTKPKKNKDGSVTPGTVSYSGYK